MSKKPLIEVQTEEAPDGSLDIHASIDLKFAILAIVLLLVACVAMSMTVCRALGIIFF